MEKPFLNSSNMEFEHQRWKGEIEFWKNELESFNNKLSELITRWADKKELAEVGYYQKQFIYHDGVIEDLLDSIEQKETQLSSQIDLDNFKEVPNLSEKHIELRKRMEKQREIYAELKKNIFRFLEQKYIG